MRETIIKSQVVDIVTNETLRDKGGRKKGKRWREVIAKNNMGDLVTV